VFLSWMLYEGMTELCFSFFRFGSFFLSSECLLFVFVNTGQVIVCVVKPG